MSWTVAESLLQLDREIKAKYPGRSTRSDGFIGDAAHRGRGSAHNPDNDGIVRAGDWTSTDTAGKQIPGFGAEILEAAKKHPSALLVIHQGKIWSRNHGWRERKYNGSNPHTTHVHVSLLNNIEGKFTAKQLADAASSTRAWGVSGSVAPAPAPSPGLPSTGVSGSMRKGSRGDDVAALQRNMNRVFPAYSKLAVDGIFGTATDKVVREFQRRVGVTVDGIVGPVTLRELGKHGIQLGGAPSPAPAKPVRYRVVTKTLPLVGRAGPSKTSRQTMSAHRGAILSIVETRNGWARSTGGHWYSMQYLKRV